MHEARLKDKIERYIAAHPDLSRQRASQLRALTVHPGMTKDEVTLFLNAAGEVIRGPQELAKRAEKLWRELQGRVDEAWVYGPYTYFFQGPIVIDIQVSAPAFQPLRWEAEA